MPLHFSPHARRRLVERQITEEQVELVLRRPIGDPFPGSRPDTLVFRGRLGGRVVKVVVDSVDIERVVTVMVEGEGQ